MSEPLSFIHQARSTKAVAHKRAARLTHLDHPVPFPVGLRRRRLYKLHHLVDFDEPVLADDLLDPRRVALDPRREFGERRERSRSLFEREERGGRADDGEPRGVVVQFRAARTVCRTVHRGVH